MGKFFDEIIIMKEDGTIITRCEQIDYIPNVNNSIFYLGKKMKVVDVVFDYDLFCIKIYCI